MVLAFVVFECLDAGVGSAAFSDAAAVQAAACLLSACSHISRRSKTSLVSVTFS
jgi:hypothetical protein